MFPSCHYENWDSRWWAPGYPVIMKLQKQTIYLRKQHKYLEKKFQSNEFDYLFASEIGTIDDDKAATKQAAGENRLMPSQRI